MFNTREKVTSEIQRGKYPGLWVMAVVFCVYVLVLIASKRSFVEVGSFALGFQFFCWGLAVALLIELNPLHQLRISDLGVMVVIWMTMYLIVPSVFLFLGIGVPDTRYLAQSEVVTLLWLHGMFIITVISAYLLTRPIQEIPKNSDIRRLPSGWVLLLVLLIPMIFETLQRVASGKGILPPETYGENWFAMRASIAASRAHGGLDYFWTQIAQRLGFYPNLFQGLGVGLIFVRVAQSGRSKYSSLIVVGLVMLFMLLLGTGGRSGVIMVCLIGLVLADRLSGPIRWRHILPAFFVALVLFDFLGSYRPYRNLPFPKAINKAMEEYTSSDFERLGEFTTMFSKESLVLQMVHEKNSYLGTDYFVQQVMALVPSQLYPEKLQGELQIEATGVLLSRRILGPVAVDAGAGTAGAAIGDGYRLGGIWGVPLLGIVFGTILGLSERLMIGFSRNGRKKSLFRLLLFAGLSAWTFLIIRSDLTELLQVLLFNCVLPLFVVALVPRSILEKNRWISSVFQTSQQKRLQREYWANSSVKPNSAIGTRKERPDLPDRKRNSAERLDEKGDSARP